MIYKALCAGRLLKEFYPDLADRSSRHRLRSSISATRPTCCRRGPLLSLFACWAQRRDQHHLGNRARMEARAATLPLDVYPVLTEGGSDSTSLDEIVELLAHNGRTVAEAVRMVVPPANPGNLSSFLQYSGDCMEPWDGPAALAFTDGHQVGAILDRNGLRPLPICVDDQGLVVAGSEAGLVDMDPASILHSGRSAQGK